jgi:tRNA pseudouridine38-40 synthase
LTKYKLSVSYDGSFFNGYQKQNHKKTIEDSLFISVKKIFSDVNKMYASGRTDKGVHAENQIITFQTKKFLDANRLSISLNKLTPSSIVINDVEVTFNSFDPRKNATRRVYKYLFSPKSSIIPLYLKPRIVELPFNFNESILTEISPLFVGKKDFIMFRKNGSNIRGTVRHVFSFDIQKKIFNCIYTNSPVIYFQVIIIANSYLYRMVRNIVGSIFEVLKGKYTVQDLNDFISKRKMFNYTTAPAKGLSLVKVEYEGD